MLRMASGVANSGLGRPAPPLLPAGLVYTLYVGGLGGGGAGTSRSQRCSVIKTWESWHLSWEYTLLN